jgi:nucleoside-diphosphate-sugar epimerase
MKAASRRLLVTGGTGFIGRPLLHILHQSGAWEEIHSVSRTKPVDADLRSGLVWHEADLLQMDTAEALIKTIRPTHLVHTAWVTDHGAFWQAESNRDWLQASVRLAGQFACYGGQRFVQLGSVAEYEWDSGRMFEGSTAERPASLYGASKLAFSRYLSACVKKGEFSAATGRVFFVYGPDEKPERLVPSLCRSLLGSHSATFGSGALWRDYLYIDDLCRAIIALLNSPLEGTVNLASGMPVRLSFIYDLLERISGKSGFLQRGTRPASADEIPILFGDAHRLATTGWRPIVTFEEGLSHTLDWWRDRTG